MKQPNNILFRDHSGFSLIELLVYMAILGVLMTAVMSSFTSTLQRSAQQSSIAETKIETSVGLDLLRTDLEHAGFGLPWEYSGSPAPFAEPNPFAGAANDVPRALNSEDNSANSLNGADYLAIRATSVARGIASQKWGNVGRDSSHNIDVQSMGPETLLNSDRLIVLRAKNTPGEFRRLVLDGANNYIVQKTAMTGFAPADTPNDPDGEKYLVYGLNDDAQISRPFNRTDYYIDNSNVPGHCAQNTGVLYKATANQDPAATNPFSEMPVIDCVADFQVVYYLDTDGDGGWDIRANADDLNGGGLTAEQIREQVKMVRCYILTHEGRSDRTYTHPNATINVGEVAANGTTLLAGQAFTLSTIIGGTWANYRWKVESIAVSPKNLK